MKRFNGSLGFVSTGLRLVTLSYVPTPAAALSWTTCTKDESGKQVCKDNVPRGAKIPLALACLGVIILLLTLVACICRTRRSAVAAEKEYNVEASQVDGPPTIIATEYNPTSGPSRVYSASGNNSGRPTSPHPQVFPATVHHQHYRPSEYTYQGPNQTAPVSQVSFPAPAYPFVGYSSSDAPKTAYVTGGFPRSPLAGERLKERIKERPASVSTLNTILPPYPVPSSPDPKSATRRTGTL